MPNLANLMAVVGELTTWKKMGRTLEPHSTMAEPEQVAAYNNAGSTDGVMASVYLFHTIHMCEILVPGDTVIDLGCGPGSQLAQVASLNPDTRFIGFDLSEPMLQCARDHATNLGLKNIELRCQDMSRLNGVPDASVNAIVSSMAMHHLPSRDDLLRTFAEIHRVLRPGGGIYVADFGRLRSPRTVQYFAQRRANLMPRVFMEDYLNSLKAAFAVADFRAAAVALEVRAALKTTFGTPFMVALKSPRRRALPADLVAALRQIRRAMPAYLQEELNDLTTFFAWGGLRLSANI